MKTRIILFLVFFLCAPAAFSQNAQTEMNNNINDLKNDITKLKRSDKAISNKVNKVNSDLLKQLNSVNADLTEKENSISANADSIKNLSSVSQKMQARIDSNISGLEKKFRANTIFTAVLFVLFLGSWIILMVVQRKNLRTLKMSYDSRLADLEHKKNLEHQQINDRINAEDKDLKDIIGKLREETEKKIHDIKI